jgi:hypothetical protein
MGDSSHIGENTVIVKFGGIEHQMTIKKLWDSLAPQSVDAGGSEVIDLTSIPGSSMMIYGSEGFTRIERLERIKNSGKAGLARTWNGQAIILSEGSRLSAVDAAGESAADFGIGTLNASKTDSFLEEKYPNPGGFSQNLGIDSDVAYSIGYVSTFFFDKARKTLGTKIQFFTGDDLDAALAERNKAFKARVVPALEYKAVKKDVGSFCVPISKLRKIFKLLNIDLAVVEANSRMASECPPSALSWDIKARFGYICGVFDACGTAFMGSNISVRLPTYKFMNQFYDLLRLSGIACKKNMAPSEDSPDVTVYRILVRAEFDSPIWSGVFRKLWDLSFLVGKCRGIEADPSWQRPDAGIVQSLSSLPSRNDVVEIRSIVDGEGESDLGILCFDDPFMYKIHTESGSHYSQGLVVK